MTTRTTSNVSSHRPSSVALEERKSKSVQVATQRMNHVGFREREKTFVTSLYCSSREVFRRLPYRHCREKKKKRERKVRWGSDYVLCSFFLSSALFFELLSFFVCACVFPCAVSVNLMPYGVMRMLVEVDRPVERRLRFFFFLSVVHACSMLRCKSSCFFSPFLTLVEKTK